MSSRKSISGSAVPGQCVTAAVDAGVRPAAALNWSIWIFVGYALFLLWLIVRHEVWRDEVRAYSVTRSATNPVELIRTALADEGHPCGWYLLLWSGLRIADNPVVLKVAAYLVALAFSALVFFRSPFPLLHRTLFLFGVMPLYEHAVIARNYGIADLCLFLLANEYARPKGTSPWRAGVYNALLANTNVYGTLCAGAFLLVPLHEPTVPRARRWADWGVVCFLSVAGLLLAVYTMWPTPENLMFHPSRQPATGRYVGVSTFAGPLGRMAVDRDLWSVSLLTGMSKSHRLEWREWLDGRLRVTRGSTVIHLVCGLPGLLLLCLPFRRFPWLLAAGGFAYLAAGLFSNIVYLADDRHLGVLAAFLFALVWIARARTPDIKSRSSYLLLAGLALILAAHACAAAVEVSRSFREPFSQSARAGRFLAAAYPESVVMCEPDFYAESLPYYTDDPLFCVRAGAFQTYVHLTRPSNRGVTLADLMKAVDEWSETTRQPAILSLWTPVEDVSAGVISRAFGRDLDVNEQDLAAFRERFHEVGRFLGPGRETYIFYSRNAK